MLNEETLQESRIQAVDIPERILRRETRCNPQTKRRVSYRQGEIDKQGLLVRSLRQSDSNIASDRRNTGSAFGAGKNQQLPPFWEQSLFMERVCGPNQSLGCRALIYWQKEVFASAGAHDADSKSRVGVL
jgi:hypothetical protein